MGNPFVPPDDFNDQQRKDFYMDLVFIFILGVMILSFTILSCKGLKNKANRNIHNYIMSAMIACTMIDRFACMIWSEYIDSNKKVYDFTVQFYFYYQLPFDLLNFAVIA